MQQEEHVYRPNRCEFEYSLKVPHYSEKINQLSDFILECRKSQFSQELTDLLISKVSFNDSSWTHRLHLNKLRHQIQLSVPKKELWQFMTVLENLRVKSPIIFDNMLVQELFVNDYFQPFAEVDTNASNAHALDEEGLMHNMKNFLKLFSETLKLRDCYFHVWSRVQTLEEEPENPFGRRFHIYVRSSVDGRVPYRMHTKTYLERIKKEPRLVGENAFWKVDLHPIENGQMRAWNSAKLCDYTDRNNLKQYEHWQVWKKDGYSLECLLPEEYERTRGAIWCGSVLSWDAPEFRVYYRAWDMKPKFWDELNANLPHGVQIHSHPALRMSNLTFNWRPSKSLNMELNEMYEHFKTFEGREASDVMDEIESIFIPVAQRFIGKLDNKMLMLQPSGIHTKQDSEGNQIWFQESYEVKSYGRSEFVSHAFFNSFNLNLYKTNENNRQKRKIVKFNLAEFLFSHRGLVYERRTFSHVGTSNSPNDPKTFNFFTGLGIFPGEAAEFVRNYPMFSKVAIQTFLKLLRFALCAAGDLIFNKWGMGALLHHLLFLTHSPTSKDFWEWVIAFVGVGGSGKNLLQILVARILGQNNVKMDSGIDGAENLLGKFNLMCESTCLIVLDELQVIETELMQRIKSASTAHTTNFNGKYEKPFTGNHLGKFWILANKFNAAIQQGDRRMLILMCKKHHDGENFYDLANKLFIKYDGWKAIAFYLFSLRENAQFRTMGQEPCASSLKSDIILDNRSKAMDVIEKAHRELNWEKMPIIESSKVFKEAKIDKLQGSPSPGKGSKDDLNKIYDDLLIKSDEYDSHGFNAGLAKIPAKGYYIPQIPEVLPFEIFGSSDIEERRWVQTEPEKILEYGPQWPAFLPLKHFCDIVFNNKTALKNEFLAYWENAWLELHESYFFDDPIRKDFHQKRIDAGKRTSTFMLNEFPHFDYLVLRNPSGSHNTYTYYQGDVLLLPPHSKAESFFQRVYKMPRLATADEAKKAFPKNWTLFEQIVDCALFNRSEEWTEAEDTEDFYQNGITRNLRSMDPEFCKVPPLKGENLDYVIDARGNITQNYQ